MPTLYGNGENGRTQCVLSAARYGGTQLQVKNQSPPADKFPFAISPALEDGKTLISGSAGIQWHVGGEALKGQTQQLQPQVVEWLTTSDSVFRPAVLSVVLPSLSMAPLDKKAFDASTHELHHLMMSLDAHLLSRTYLVGERVSHADLALAFTLLPAFQHVMDAEHRSAHANVTRWFLTVMNQPEVKSVVAELTLCQTIAQFDAENWKANQALVGSSDAHHDKHHGGQHHGGAHGKHEDDNSSTTTTMTSEAVTTAKKGKNKKRDKKKSECSEGGDHKKKDAPKKADKKEKEPAEEMDAAEAAMAAEPKQTDPYAGVPKGTSFVMDEFKRVYSNEDTIAKAIPFFWEKFDPEHYSIWYSEYKFPKELSLVFMSCNLIGGMFQRLEKLKKNAFASMCLFGKDNDSTISGVWVFLGQELAFTLSSDWQVDYESYSWEKLDPSSEKTKKLVNAYWAWEGFEGKEFNQGKILK